MGVHVGSSEVAGPGSVREHVTRSPRLVAGVSSGATVTSVGGTVVDHDDVDDVGAVVASSSPRSRRV